MARPVEFDEDKVLTNAMEQFWKEGYEASSVRKLLDCTGINRGTLYNSFGDKDTFFNLFLNDHIIMFNTCSEKRILVPKRIIKGAPVDACAI